MRDANGLVERARRGGTKVVRCSEGQFYGDVIVTPPERHLNVSSQDRRSSSLDVLNRRPGALHRQVAVACPRAPTD